MPKKKIVQANLPPGVTFEDTQYVQVKYDKDGNPTNPQDVVSYGLGNGGHLTFYEVASGKGDTWWCVTTLGIS